MGHVAKDGGPEAAKARTMPNQTQTAQQGQPNAPQPQQQQQQQAGDAPRAPGSQDGGSRPFADWASI